MSIRTSGRYSCSDWANIREVSLSLSPGHSFAPTAVTSDRDG
jgi:hypothetical protein